MVEIDCIEAGQGFGEAEFITGRKRQVRTITVGECLLGKLELSAFDQVLENYKQRVYFKKRDMFMKCPLFMKLDPVRLSFIINNTKPMSLGISKQLVRQEDPVDFVYLIDKGQVSLWK